MATDPSTPSPVLPTPDPAPTAALTDVVTTHATVTTGTADDTRVVAITPDHGLADNTPPTPLPLLPASPSSTTASSAGVATITVPYQAPHVRALSTAQRTALASLGAAVLTVALRLALTFVQGGNYSAAALQAFLLVLLQGVLVTALAGLQKLTEASGEDPLKIAEKIANLNAANTNRIDMR